ncbi:MAG TPA: APC family permease [candidate division Zixibacteria bacterium]|nr:APC family permease [candidate division Zixibacteria bacterium]
MTATTAQAEGGAPRLFVRKTSGLIRTIGVGGAIVFGVHCISLSSSGILTFYSVPALWPGANILVVLTLAAILCAMHGYTFSQIGAAAPRAGADYTLASRTLSPWLAFPASFALVLFSGLVAGSLIAWIPTVALPALLTASGILYNAGWATSLSEFSRSQAGILVFGTAGVLITLITLFYPTRAVVRMMGIGFVLGLVAWAVILFSFATGSESGFREGWNQYVPAMQFDEVIPRAQAQGMVLDTSFGNTAIAGLIMGFWIFYGYYIPTFFAGEVKEAPRTLLWGAWGALGVTWAIFTVGVLLFTRFVPQDWMAAQGYLFVNGDPDANPFVTFYASVLQPNVIFFLVMAIGFIYTLINLAQTYFFYASRIMFAWAFDRIVPEWIAEVHPETGSPRNAVLLIAVLAELGVLASAFYSVIFVQLNFVFYAAITMLVPVTAAIVYPYVKRHLWEQGAGHVRATIGGVPTMTVVGIGTLAFLLLLVASPFIWPAVGFGDQQGQALLVFGTIVALGVVIFAVSRWYRRREEGIDIMATFQEVPPA